MSRFRSDWLSRTAAILLLVGLIVAVYALAVAPLIAAYRTADRAIEQAEALLLRYERIARSREALQAQLEELKARQAAIGIYLSGDTDALAAAELQDIVNATIEPGGGKLRSIQILPAKTVGEFRRVSVRVQMTATIAQFARILYVLEAGKTFLFVDNLDISNRRARRRKDAAADPTLLIRLDLFGYLRPEIG
ncbi:MAG: type II secretion system protein GspM [Kiloniellaceae bacterium]